MLRIGGCIHLNASEVGSWAGRRLTSAGDQTDSYPVLRIDRMRDPVRHPACGYQERQHRDQAAGVGQSLRGYRAHASERSWETR